MTWENSEYTDTDGTALGDASTDVDGDGYAETITHDQNLDGTPDSIELDTNLDGLTDTTALDSDQNGVAESVSMDNNGDGIPEAVMHFNNQSGQPESVTTPESGFADPAPDAGVLGGTSDGSDFIGGSGAAYIGGTPSGGTFSSLTNSPIIMNDPDARPIVQEMAEEDGTRLHSTPDGFMIVDPD